MDARGRVPGRVAGHHRLRFYGLSTCVWCRRARQLLEELGVPFDFTYVDLLDDAERERVFADLEAFGRGETFPTLVVDDARCVIGFQPDEIRRAVEP